MNDMIGHQMVGGYLVATIARGNAGPSPCKGDPDRDWLVMNDNPLLIALRNRPALRYIGWPHTVRNINARRHGGR